VTVTNIAGTRFNDEFTKFLPRVILDWKFAEDRMVYVLGSLGNNPGDFNTAIGLQPEQRVVQEESLTNYEVGLKSSWLERRLSLNVAAYHMKWKDQQQRRSFTLPVNGVPTLFAAVFNEGDSTSQGIEIETAFVPSSAWDLRLGLNYQDATFDSFCSTNLYTLRDGRTLAQGGLPQQCLPVDGNQLEAQPEFSGSLSATWTRPWSERGAFYIGGDVIYQAGTWESEMNLAKSASATNTNLRIGMQRDGLRLEAYARNLFDEDAPARVARLSDFSLGTTASVNQNVAVSFRRPQQYGARVVWEIQ
jgi:iron complex outermembrane receptor protein